CILVPRQRASSSSFPPDIPRPNRDRQSAGTNRGHSRSPKSGSRKTDNSTSSPAKSCSSSIENQGVGDGDAVSDAKGSSLVPFVSKIIFPSEISNVFRLVRPVQSVT